MKVFIGYDPRQTVAFQVCAQSVWQYASEPISITRLDLRTLPIQRRGLTEFTYSRFLVPYLSGFKGKSLFLDSDIICRADVRELLQFTGKPESNVAMVLGKKRFEWASVMLFNNEACKQMTPEYVNTAPMFDFAWAKDPLELPKEWNHLVGYDEPNPDAKIVHFTMGIPVWKETIKSEFAQEWINVYKSMNSSVSFEELMGRSVHVPHLSKVAG